MEIWFCKNVSSGVNVHKKIWINFLKIKWRRRIFRKQIRFFLAMGPIPLAILHLEQKTRKILKIYIRIKWAWWDVLKFRFFVKWHQHKFFLLKLTPFFEKSKFRKNPTTLTSFLYIFLISFAFFVLSAKLRPVVVQSQKKNEFFCEILHHDYVFKKFIKIFFMHLNPCRDISD